MWVVIARSEDIYELWGEVLAVTWTKKIQEDPPTEVIVAQLVQLIAHLLHGGEVISQLDLEGVQPLTIQSLTLSSDFLTKTVSSTQSKSAIITT